MRTTAQRSAAQSRVMRQRTPAQVEAWRKKFRRAMKPYWESRSKGPQKTVLTRFLDTPVKNRIQEAQCTYADQFLGIHKGTVLDLPGTNLEKSLKMFEHYSKIFVAERDRDVFRKILADQKRLDKDHKVGFVLPGDFFGLPFVLNGHNKVSLVNYDGMKTLDKQVLNGLKSLLESDKLAQKWVLRLTCSMRGRCTKAFLAALTRFQTVAKRNWDVDRDRTIYYREGKRGGVMATTQLFLEKK